MKKSFCTIAYRHTEKTIFDIIPELAEIGYDGVEIWWPHVEKLSAGELTDVRELAAARGIAIPIVSGYLGNYNLEMTNAAEQKALVETIAPVSKTLGARLMRAFVGWTCECSSATASEEYWQYNIDGFRDLVAAADRHGLNLALETHSMTLVDSVSGCRRMIDALGDRIQINLQLDTIAELSGLPDGEAVYEALKDRVVHFHFHADDDLSDSQIREYTAVFSAMRANAYNGYISWENCSGAGDPADSARRGLDVMRQLGV